jgi:WD40 repeat protein
VSQVKLHTVEAEAPKAIFALDRRAQCLAFPCENSVLTGSEEGAVRLWDLRVANGAVITIPRAHSSRVKALAPFSGGRVREIPGPVASASSDGSVKLWDFRVVTSTASGESFASRLVGFLRNIIHLHSQ